MKHKHHTPGRPTTPEPPKLATVAAGIKHPDVVNSGVTTTPTGNWALLVTVRQNAPLPVAGLGKKLDGFPIVYRQESSRQMVARPAYPALGE